MAEIGFGKASNSGNHRRLINRDGSFNLKKVGIGFINSITAYDKLIKTSWSDFFFSLAVIYTCSNIIFACVYFLLGHDVLAGTDSTTGFGYFLTCFFFSIQTFATIGYGVIHPIGTLTNSIVAVESLVGILEVSIFTGLMFARFSRPRIDVMFSNVALVAPYKDKMSFQFRLMNLRSSQLLEPRMRVVFSRIVETNGTLNREYFPLKLLIDQIIFMPLYWTVTHVIEHNSPFANLTEQELLGSEPEALILFSGIDEVTGEGVYVRTSFYAREFVYGARFVSMYIADDKSQTSVAADNLHRYEMLGDISNTTPLAQSIGT